MCLTGLAIIASACIVVWVVSGYEALVGEADSTATEYLGRYDLFLVPDAPGNPALAPELIAGLRADPAVAAVEPVSQTPVRVLNPEAVGPMGSGDAPSPKSGPGPGRRPGGGQPSLVGTVAIEPPYTLIDGRWIDPRKSDLRETVISNALAQQLDLGLGSPLLVIVGTKEYALKVIGICAQVTGPAGSASAGRRGLTGGPATSALYVPQALADHFTRQSAHVNLLYIKLKPGAKVDTLRTAWLPRLTGAQPPALLLSTAEIKAGFEEAAAMAGARRQAWAATGIALLAALFIIFTTLSMGVNERVRQLAVMRAVGLTRSQVAGLIVGEGLLLAVLGWAGGLAAGWGLLALAAHARPEVFTRGLSLGVACVVLTGISAVGGALAASIVPAWQATRVEPLEALSPRRRWGPSRKRLIVSGLVGAGLIAVNPLLVFVAPIPNALRYGIYELLGCTSMAIGFLLLAPLAIVAVERLLGPWIGRLAGVDPRLLASQLSSNLGRTLGTTVALTVGLGLFVALQVWGYSMLQPFLPGEWAPDVFVGFPGPGLADADVEAVRRVPGVKPGQCLPLAVEQPRLAGNLTNSAQGSSITRQDNVVLVGLDPQVAFGGSTPLLKLDLAQGTRQDVVALLGQGRYCIVPDYFARATGLGVGDRFGLLPPDQPERPVQYTIAAVVSLPGSHMMTKQTGLRRRSGRMAALVFASFGQVRQDFAVKNVNFFWMNVEPGTGAAQLGAGLGPIASRNMDALAPHGQAGEFSARGRGGPRILPSADLRNSIQKRSEGMIWMMSQIPLITLWVASLGVVNTVMASVRARRWELGVLRAVGVTRWGLCAMVLAEGLLVGLVACGLSLAFGVMAGWCGTGISQYVSFFGGLSTPLIIPWSQLAIGFGLTMGLCLAAAAWPAIATGRAEPLQLLQAGRGAL
jgi:putative ABC transport system permease protein